MTHFFGDSIIKILKNGTYQINNQNRTQHQYYYNGRIASLDLYLNKHQFSFVEIRMLDEISAILIRRDKKIKLDLNSLCNLK
jgi:hypothetical protein